jgi:hypothetical protein
MQACGDYTLNIKEYGQIVKKNMWFKQLLIYLELGLNPETALIVDLKRAIRDDGCVSVR